MTLPGWCPRCLTWMRSKAHYAAHIRWSPSCRLTPVEILERYLPHRPTDPRACWLWEGTAKLSPESQRWYGALTYEGRHWQAHRFVYTLEVGDIPAAHDLEHLCNETMCARPTHLLPVTRLEHFKRTRRRRTSGKSAMPAGAPVPW